MLEQSNAASVRGRIATGPYAGQEVMRFGDRVDPETVDETTTPRCARSGGMSLHANVAVPARDRARLERLCRYVARFPVALDRLSTMDDAGATVPPGRKTVVYTPKSLEDGLSSGYPQSFGRRLRGPSVHRTSLPDS